MTDSQTRTACHEATADEPFGLIRELCENVQAAMVALADDHPANLYQQLARLELTAGALRRCLVEGSGPADSSTQIRAATGCHTEMQKLARLNRTLAVLLQKRRRTVSLLHRYYQSALCGGLSDETGIASHTLSAEV